VSVEAISWALNLAPVPRGRGGTRNSACKAVLIGLANHAAPDGTGAFPSVRTLARYTDLSERTVRTALDRLEAEGIICPCDPAIVAAKIKRADQRPKGWDLAMHLVRDDLSAEELAALEAQFPGLASRVAANTQANAVAADGVQPLHPVLEAAVDNVPRGVQPLHPAAATGCNQRSNGVQRLPERGAAAAPEPPVEPSLEPPAPACARRAAPMGSHGTAVEVAGAGEFFAALGPRWLLSIRQRHRLTPAVQAALAAGWTPSALARYAAANPDGVRNPYAVLASRLAPGELPAPAQPPPRPPWCGHCHHETRRLEHADGTDAGRCPRCHPLAPPPAAPGRVTAPGAAGAHETRALPAPPQDGQIAETRGRLP
jgi:hypothetical protein